MGLTKIIFIESEKKNVRYERTCTIYACPFTSEIDRTMRFLHVKNKWKMRIEKSDYNVENGWLVAHGQTHVLRPKTNHLRFEIAFAQSTLPNELHVFRNLFSVQSAFII